MIYIDPPYNTGNGDFIYNDERSFTPQSLAQMANIEIEEASSILNLTLKNSSTHSAWLSFMYPRLYIARQLLRDDGVIFISIDDNEQANLKLLCDEIFGEDNFICNFIWQKNFAPKNDNKYISESTDYILCYSKYKDCFNRNLLPRTDKHDLSYSNPDNDKRGKWTSGSILVTTFSKNAVYEIIAPNGKKHFPPEGRSWRYSKETFKDLLEDNRIWFGQDGNGVPRVKRFLSEMPDGIVPQNLLLYQEVGSSQSGNKDLKDIFQIQLFDFPKPLNLIKHFLQISTTPNSNDIILDFFAGSGTTAQAVMELNAEDKGNREFILVQLDEVIDKSKSKTAYEFCKNELKSENPVISDITAERVRRASAKIAQNSNLDLGFKIYELRENDFDSQNGALFKEVDKNALLESFRLQDSTPLSVENQTIDLGGYKAIRAGEKLYLLNSGFEMKHLQKLISLIDAQKDFVIKEISYLNDAFESARIREIEEGIKSYSNKKGLKILVRGRFI